MHCPKKRDIWGVTYEFEGWEQYADERESKKSEDSYRGGIQAMKRLAWAIVILMFAGSAFAKGEIQSKYDKFKDVTQVSTKPVGVQRGFGGLALSFSYTCEGDTDSCHPERVFAVFNCVSTNGLYTKLHSVTFLADGARIVPVEEETWGRDVWDDSVTTSVYETITAPLSVADFLRIAGANQVEGEVGPTHFSAKDKQLKFWQELAQKIGH